MGVAELLSEALALAMTVSIDELLLDADEMVSEALAVAELLVSEALAVEVMLSIKELLMDVAELLLDVAELLLDKAELLVEASGGVLFLTSLVTSLTERESPILTISLVFEFSPRTLVLSVALSIIGYGMLTILIFKLEDASLIENIVSISLV